MLTSLSIRDIVLIERLALSFSDGLNVLTGETGAGKSILLDSLGLALGMRADRALVRRGAEKGIVTATFDVTAKHRACQLLDDSGLAHDDGDIVLRRQITADGRSKAWINDQPVGQTMLADVGAALVEIHGQHDDRGLLDASAHRGLLDEYAAVSLEKGTVQDAYAAYRAACARATDIRAAVETARKDEDYIRHAVDELEKLAPQEGEEETLAARRTLMMQSEKSAQELADLLSALTHDEGVDAVVRGVLRRISRLDSVLADKLDSVTQKLDQASDDLAVAIDEMARTLDDMQYSGHELEQVEERLFEFRRLARKHDCPPDALPGLYADLSGKLEGINNGDTALQDAAAEVKATREAFETAVAALTAKRRAASTDLDAAVNAELPSLKLEKAVFRTTITALEAADWSAEGGERITFEVKTNDGTPFGPMVKVASGGELARFILALKVVLAKNTTVPVMVFDEVDRGIGGATASAVGDRLKKLTVRSQVLVVTHSPQVAARGDSQFQISKADENGTTRTTVVELSAPERLEEIARMLAGAEITDAARAAAAQLLNSESRAS